jgi:hypothetical protein
VSPLASADYAPQAPPAVLVPLKPARGREESRAKSAAVTVGLVVLVAAFVVLLAIAAFLAVFVVLSAFAPS